MDIMDIRDIMDIMDIMDILDILDIMDIMDIMIITAWMAMAGAVSALVLFKEIIVSNQKSPVHPISESSGGYPERHKRKDRRPSLCLILDICREQEKTS